MEIRKYIETDAFEIIKWINNEREFRLWCADRYDKYPIAPHDINDNYQKYLNANFHPLTLVDNNKVVGHIILRNIDDDLSSFRLGFIIIDSSIRKKGYGKKLINEAMEYARKYLNAKSFNLGVFVNNESALKCYESVGFVTEKIEKDAYKFYDESWDCLEMIYKGRF